MKKATLIPVLFLIIGIISAGCMPIPETMPIIAPTGTPQPTPIPPTATTQPTEVVLEGERYYEKEGGFSYIIPDGWEIFEIPGLKYLGLTESNPKGLFPSNVVFADERYDGLLKDYVDLALTNIQQIYPDMEILSIDKVDTDSGISGISVVATNEVNSLQMVQVLFMFDIGERILVITYTSAIDAGTENIIAIGDVIRSLRVNN